MKYRKKPVVIEAVQFTGEESLEEAANFMAPTPLRYRPSDEKLIIDTLEGEHLASAGDWIIKGVVGEFYPCKPDVFELTYEKVEEAEW